MAARQEAGIPSPGVEWDKLLQKEVRPLYYRYLFKKADAFGVLMEAVADARTLAAGPSDRAHPGEIARAAVGEANRMHNQFQDSAFSRTIVDFKERTGEVYIGRPEKSSDASHLEYVQIETSLPQIGEAQGVPNFVLYKHLELGEEEAPVTIRTVASFLEGMGILNIRRMIEFAKKYEKENVAGAKALYSESGGLLAHLYVLFPIEKEANGNILFATPQTVSVSLRPHLSAEPSHEALLRAREMTIGDIGKAQGAFMQSASLL